MCITGTLQGGTGAVLRGWNTLASVSNNLERDVAETVETESQERDFIPGLSKDSNPRLTPRAKLLKEKAPHGSLAEDVMGRTK